MRKDKQKNIWKVAEVIAKDPHATDRDIAKITWLSVWAAHSSKKEVEQSWTKDETIKYIVDSSKNRIRRAQWIFDRFLDQVEEKSEITKSDVWMVKELVKDDQARVENLWWSITDENGGMKDFVINLIRK